MAREAALRGHRGACSQRGARRRHGPARDRGVRRPLADPLVEDPPPERGPPGGHRDGRLYGEHRARPPDPRRDGHRGDGDPRARRGDRLPRSEDVRQTRWLRPSPSGRATSRRRSSLSATASAAASRSRPRSRSPPRSHRARCGRSSFRPATRQRASRCSPGHRGLAAQRPLGVAVRRGLLVSIDGRRASTHVRACSVEDAPPDPGLGRAVSPEGAALAYRRRERLLHGVARTFGIARLLAATRTKISKRLRYSASSSSRLAPPRSSTPL